MKGSGRWRSSGKAFEGRWTQCYGMRQMVDKTAGRWNCLFLCPLRVRLSSWHQARNMTRSKGEKLLPEGSQAMGEDDQGVSRVLCLKGAIPANRQAIRP